MSEEKRELTCREAGQIGGKKRLAEIGSEGFAAMGRKGGEVTKERHGEEHYRAIGQQGGAKVARERGTEFFKEIGRKGGSRVKALIARAKAEEEKQGSL